MTCMKQEFCIHEKYCQRHIGQNFDSCILFSRNSKPMTNEEWFCNLSTEEKAEFSMRVFLNCTWCLDGGNPKECPFNEFSEHCPAESKENMMKWLKEKHE